MSFKKECLSVADYLDEDKKIFCQSLIGSLMYTIVVARPEMEFGKVLSRLVAISSQAKTLNLGSGRSSQDEHSVL
jgi:hypothetical protein